MRKQRYWLLAAGATLALRSWLLFTAAVPFNSDEAVVGLMARHILQGARPLFFYGQSYMGSLDAYLIAGGFGLFGEQLWVIRVVQMLLYCGTIYTGWLLARRLLHDEQAADFAALLMAIPPVVVTTYTSATLGGYGESLVLGNLILILGYDVLMSERAERGRTWFALGLVGGLAFWTLGIAGVYLLPVGLLGLLGFRRAWLAGLALAAAGFLLGSLPWWIENLVNDWAALDVLLGRSALQLAPTGPLDRLFGLLLVGLPALLGFREPWEAQYESIWMIAVGVLLAAGVALFVIEARRKQIPVWAPGAGRMLFVFVLGYGLIFVGTHFGVDATGRYLLPLYLPLVLASGALAGWLARHAKILGLGFAGLVLAFNLAGVWIAAASPDGLTTQFDPITRFDNSYDAELIAFLHEEGLDRGYSNYWVSYRIAFLSGEQLIYAPRLPYKADLSYTPNDNRYPLYDEIVGQSPEAAFITTLHPQLDGEMTAAWTSAGIRFKSVEIGPYRVFYDFSGDLPPLALLDLVR